ncbi:MAG: hypothetical protein U1E23_09410 [Reyranellaceae bacterium]
MQSFCDLIDKLGGPVVLAPVLGQTQDAVRKMRARNRVAPMHWRALIDLAREQGVRGVTVERIAALAMTAPSGRRDKRAA